MAVITNRPAKLLIENLEYPGFLSFSGNDSSIGESGLIQFQATIEVAHHPGNPQSLSSRQNRFWCFGKRVEIYVMNAEKNWILHPRGGLWIYTAFYDIQSRVLNIQCGCLLYILKNRSTTDFESPEDLINVTESKVDPETDEAIAIEDEKYWWEQWNKPGTIDIDDIVSEILQQLNLTKIGRAIGKIRTPWQPSGSLLQACGGLVFKSIAPSYLWCDNSGKIHIEKIPARLNRANVAYTPGGNSATSPNWLWAQLPSYEEDADLQILIGGDRGDEIEYTPYDSGEEPIKELVVTGTWKIENPEMQVADDGASFKCSKYTEFGPEVLINPGGNAETEVAIARGERCEYNYVNKKVIKEWREERKIILFPDSRRLLDKWIRMRETEIVQKFDPNNKDRLYNEVETTKETIGKIYNNWFLKQINFIVTNIENASTIYCDALTHDAGLQVSSIEETIYDYDTDLSLKQKKTIVKEPQSKILESYPFFSDELFITGENTEKWDEWGTYNKNHIKLEKVSWEKHDRATVERQESYLKKRRGEAGIIATETFAGYKRDGHFEESNTVSSGSTFVGGNPVSTNQVVSSPILSPQQRLTLMMKRQEEINATNNLANPPETEYFSGNLDSDENLIDTGGFVLKKWRDSGICGDYEPPREVIDLGEVFSEQVLEAVAEVIYFLRQGRSQMMEIEIPLLERIIGKYKPLILVDVVEPTGEIVEFLVDGSRFDTGGDRCVLSFDGLWIANRGSAKPITGVENEWLAI